MVNPLKELGRQAPVFCILESVDEDLKKSVPFFILEKGYDWVLLFIHDDEIFISRYVKMSHFAYQAFKSRGVVAFQHNDDILECDVKNLPLEEFSSFPKDVVFTQDQICMNFEKDLYYNQIHIDSVVDRYQISKEEFISKLETMIENGKKRRQDDDNRLWIARNTLRKCEGLPFEKSQPIKVTPSKRIRKFTKMSEEELVKNIFFTNFFTVWNHDTFEFNCSLSINIFVPDMGVFQRYISYLPSRICMGEDESLILTHILRHDENEGVHHFICRFEDVKRTKKKMFKKSISEMDPNVGLPVLLGIYTYCLFNKLPIPWNLKLYLNENCKTNKAYNENVDQDVSIKDIIQRILNPIDVAKKIKNSTSLSLENDFRLYHMVWDELKVIFKREIYVDVNLLILVRRHILTIREQVQHVSDESILEVLNQSFHSHFTITHH